MSDRRKRPFIIAVVLAGLVFGLGVAVRKRWQQFGILFTTDNCFILLNEFSRSVVQHPDAVSGALDAETLARAAYRNFAGSEPRDYWGRPLRVRASVVSGELAVEVRSAGIDAVFETADDIVVSQTFPITLPKRATTSRNTTRPSAIDSSAP